MFTFNAQTYINKKPNYSW